MNLSQLRLRVFFNFNNVIRSLASSTLSTSVLFIIFNFKVVDDFMQMLLFSLFYASIILWYVSFFLITFNFLKYFCLRP